MRYRRHGREVDAILFDGSPASAAEISARFGSFVSHHDGQVQIATSTGPIYVGMGVWVVRDVRTRRLDVIDDRAFSRDFEQVGPDETAPLYPRSFAKQPDARSWDVV